MPEVPPLRFRLGGAMWLGSVEGEGFLHALFGVECGGI